jgi:hypothetical protein
MRRIQRRKKPVDYLLPFLALISIGVIGVIGVQVWSNWDKQGKADVYFYVAEGKAKVLPFAESDWDNAYSGTKLLLGDSLKTSTSGKVVLQFFNGTLIRMAEDSAITLADVSKGSDRESIVLNMDNGTVWVKGQKSAGVKESAYEIRTRHMLVKAVGTVFEVTSGNVETVRVMDGQVKVDIYVPVGNSERVATTISVGVGQEINIDSATIKAYEDNQETSVLTALNDNFKTSNWYSWNVKEDKTPTDFTLRASNEVRIAEDSPESIATPEGDPTLGVANEVTEEKTLDEDEGNNPEVEVVALSAPKILKPEEKTNTTGKLVISGTVDKGTAKVVVESNVGGVKDQYVLSQFKFGDTTWLYNVAESYGNMKDGVNTYKIYALDSKGNKSEPSSISITYDKPKVDNDSSKVETESEPKQDEPEKKEDEIPYGF